MDEGEYLVVQNQLLAVALLVRDMPLREFVRAIERAETVGPIVDPTLYNLALPEMMQVKRLALGLLVFRESTEEVKCA